MNDPRRVLVTGSAGRLGRAAVKALVARGHHVIGFDRVPTPGLPEDRYVVGNVTDPFELESVAVGLDCIVHLAATPDDARFPRGSAPDDGDNFLSELLPNNIIGTYQVMETARAAGTPRVVLASTGQVIDGYRTDRMFPVTATALPRPRYLYSCTKVFLEAVGQVYAAQHGMAVAAVRLGWCPRDATQLAANKGNPIFEDVFLSPGDAGRFFVAAVEAKPWTGFKVVYATSKPTHVLRYDLGPAERLLGYVPQDRWPTGAEDFA
jgi:uronate dehydrogenase